MLTRRQLLKAALVAGAGLALPTTELITDAAEVARTYWALDQTHLAPVPETIEVWTRPWWRVAQVIGENRYMTTMQVADAHDLSMIRVGEMLRMGDLGQNGVYHDHLPSEPYIVRHINRETGIITVTAPVHYHASLNNVFIPSEPIVMVSEV